MRTDQVILGVVTATAVVASCAFYGQAQFVAIDREYAYVDGCTDVTVQGANLGEAATGTIGGEPFLSLVPAGFDETLPDHAQDVGFKYFGVTPAAPDRAPGFYDVVITVDGEDLTLSEGFYYLACPEAVYADAVTLDAAVPEVGGTVRLVGCSLTHRGPPRPLARRRRRERGRDLDAGLGLRHRQGPHRHPQPPRRDLLD